MNSPGSSSHQDHATAIVQRQLMRSSGDNRQSPGKAAGQPLVPKPGGSIGTASLCVLLEYLGIQLVRHGGEPLPIKPVEFSSQ